MNNLCLNTTTQKQWIQEEAAKTGYIFGPQTLQNGTGESSGSWFSLT
jgi:hypothetical protein